VFNSPTKSGSKQAAEADKSYFSPPPAVSLPKGGGAIKGMGEKFAANPVTGTGSMTVPIATSPGRSGFGPQLSLSYDSGAGNGPFGFGWSLSLPSITRKTDKGLPRYGDATESDVFILSGAEDLVPVYRQDAAGNWVRDSQGKLVIHEDEIDGYFVRRYRPRIEGLFARIERWTNTTDPSDVHWCSISKDNILTLYGKDANSRIFDPEDPRRIFSWSICETRDDKGNAVIYNYKAEDGVGVDLGLAHERNRGDHTDSRRTANRYLKHIYYGNRTPLLDATGHRPRFLTQAEIDNAGWMFEVVFDYGEHDDEAPTPGDSGDWDYRNDPFSTYRAGFEVCTTRLCQRVLIFHHIPDLPDGTEGYEGLARSTDFTYSYEEQPTDVRNPIYSFLLSVTQSGYNRQGSGYLKRSLPPVEFEYSQPVVQDTVEEVDPESLENLPIGLDGSVYQWTDLHGEGIPGILTEQAGAWFYKRNLSPIGKHPVEFAPVELMASKPNLALSGGQAQFMDLAGDGQPDLVVMDGPMPGLYEHDGQEGWQPFRPFTSRLNRDMRDPNLKFVDLDGDGHADVLITEQDALVWHPSLAEEGFGAAQRVAQALDEERGPRLVFADGSQSIYLADLSGDGLTDLVRIRNGEVCYWPNLGYGRFGAKVAMDNAPLFDNSDQFDRKRIRLADIDGSGTTDIIYLHRDGVRLYFNQSGNSWSAAEPLKVFPHIDDLVSIVPTDLLGNGTACLVWSSPLLGDGGRQMRYVSLMGEQKPHLLIKTRNNLGAETIVHYAPSTKFYLQDKRDGKPWITRLPFPVHVVERVETIDHLTGNRFVSLYRYRHGYFDGEEREFRGFGYVEQTDTEAYAELAQGNLFPVGSNEEESSHVPPVQTRTWFHTGFYLDREHISQLFAEEYYQGDAQAVLLPDTLLPEGITQPDGTSLEHELTAQEEREACRALKGSMLRQEVYALDGTDEVEHPYTVTESNYTIRQLQARDENRHAVFFAHPRESLAYHYERYPEDPRVAHQMTLEVDGFGNVMKSVAIAYPRRVPQYPEQGQIADQPTRGKTFITYTENQVTNQPNESDWYRIGLPVETCTYEIAGIEVEGLPDFIPFTLAFLREQLSLATPLPYEAFATSGIQQRLVEQVRVLYRANAEANTTDPTPLPLGEVDSLALPCETYRLAFTPGLLDGIFSAVADPAELRALLEKTGETGGGPTDGGGYWLMDGNWWIPSGRQAFNPALFYLPTETKDPFAQVYQLTYDAYPLLVRQTEDPLHNRVQIANNYRVMQPQQITDPNGNRAQVAFDTLGLVVGTAVMGKVSDPIQQGDSLDAFIPDLPQDEIDSFFADPLATAADRLGTATTRIVYELDRYQQSGQPVYAATLARESHVSDPVPAGGLKVQVSFLYSDGFGRELQTKVQAEPGNAPVRDAGGVLKCNENLVHTETRWVGTGRTIYNNKGKPVKQYEPFFSPTHEYESEPGMVECGVTPILFYDPLERVVATLHPNHTYDKVVFDPWQQATWDVNDTLTPDWREAPTQDPDVGFYFQRLGTADYLPTWYSRHSTGTPTEQDAATKAADHAGTPSTVHLDTLGRPFLTIAHNGWDAAGVAQLYATRVQQDIEGQQLTITDARGNDVMVYLHRTAAGEETRGYDLLGNGLYSHSMDAGDRWTLNNVAGNPIRGWTFFGDSAAPQLRTLRTTYDALQRPKHLWVQQGDGAELLAEQTVYGEDKPDPEATNHRGKVWQVYDQAGIVTSEDYDFKGNLRHSTRQLAQEYKQAVNWAESPRLEDAIYRSETTYDALNRPAQLVTPHCEGMQPNVIQPGYNEANLLETVDVWVRQGGEIASGPLAPGTATFRAVANINYNAKGQRELIEYGNGVTTEYTYEDETFRLIRLLSRGSGGGPSEQNLQYTYDPVGNITHIRDDSQAVIHHDGEVVEPRSVYTYDALYRLTIAEGREHRGQAANNRPEDRPDLKPHYDFNDSTRRHLDHPNDLQAMRNYTEQYEYDGVGNILAMIHQARGGDWTRRYDYAADNNRLLGTSLPGDAVGIYSARYTYDRHGNMTQMPHLPLMQWDFKDQLEASSKQVVNGGTRETTYYVYDTSGQRVRKVTERQNGTPMKERIYLGGFELYREYNGSGDVLTKERETLHVMDGQQRIALVETQTFGEPDEITGNGPVANPLIRYQLNNHLGSACVELDEHGKLISYEEFYPYGSTAYQAGRSGLEVSLKRYRYTGMERDEETGLSYHTARYYAVWLGRWCSCDPAVYLTSRGVSVDINLYAYSKYNPLTNIDQTGHDPQLIGQIYTATRQTGGVIEVYVGKTKQELIDRFSAHRHRALIRDPATTVTSRAVYADIPSSLTGRARDLAISRTLGAAEIRVATEELLASPNVRVMNRGEFSIRLSPPAANQFNMHIEPKVDVPRSEYIPRSGSTSGTWSYRSSPSGSASGTSGSTSGTSGSTSGTSGSTSGTSGSTSGTSGSASGTSGSASGTSGSASGTSGSTLRSQIGNTVRGMGLQLVIEQVIRTTSEIISTAWDLEARMRQHDIFGMTENQREELERQRQSDWESERNAAIEREARYQGISVEEFLRRQQEEESGPQLREAPSNANEVTCRGIWCQPIIPEFPSEAIIRRMLEERRSSRGR
jgi:RHS repeat-associated protein